MKVWRKRWGQQEEETWERKRCRRKSKEVVFSLMHLLLLLLLLHILSGLFSFTCNEVSGKKRDMHESQTGLKWASFFSLTEKPNVSLFSTSFWEEKERKRFNRRTGIRRKEKGRWRRERIAAHFTPVLTSSYTFLLILYLIIIMTIIIIFFLLLFSLSLSLLLSNYDSTAHLLPLDEIPSSNTVWSLIHFKGYHKFLFPTEKKKETASFSVWHHHQWIQGIIISLSSEYGSDKTIVMTKRKTLFQRFSLSLSLTDWCFLSFQTLASVTKPRCSSQ